MKLQGKVTCRFLSRITNHCNLLTDEAHAKVMRAFAHICMCDNGVHDHVDALASLLSAV